MGLTTWKNAPQGKILRPDVVVAKNYLAREELTSLDRFVTMHLDYAEDQAERNMPMTMKDWAAKLNAFLQFNERDILDHPGKVSQEMAKAFAERASLRSTASCRIACSSQTSTGTSRRLWKTAASAPERRRYRPANQDW